MTLTPLLEAPAIIRIHSFLALAVIALTIAILSLRKGSPLHRTFGWVWVILMAGVAVSSFWIDEFSLPGPFSPIHILSVVTLISLVTGVRAARAHDVMTHRRTMKSLVFFALLLAGAFTFLPGRIMFQVVSGG